MNRFVLDSSVTLSWCFADEGGEYPKRILLALKDSEAIVPSLWPYEVANALIMGERRGRLSYGEIIRAIALLNALPIRCDDGTHKRALQNVLDLARAQKLTSYDAAYLELAMQEGVPLATLDEGLKRAAAGLGVPLL